MTNTSSQAGKTWFVTGATSGIGWELTQAGLRRGDQVAAIARDVTPLDDVVEQYDGRLLTIAANVRDQAAVETAVKQTVATFGRIDVVANNAGYGLFGAVEESTDEQARAIFDTNVFGVLNVLRATLPVLRQQGSGHILQGSSLYGQTAVPGVGLLAATKYAVEGLSDALAAEVAPLGVKVTLVQPSPTATAFLSNLEVATPTADYDQTVREVQKAIGDLPPEAFSSPALVAQAILAAVDSDEPPLRLALGSAGEGEMRAALTARLADLDNWAAVTRGVDG
jgi:NAD(P)-dependent dehydrogenase (short-subunit alcohol dehydrogenase family)